MNFDELLKEGIAERNNEIKKKKDFIKSQGLDKLPFKQQGLAERLFSANPSGGFNFTPNESYEDWGVTQNIYRTPKDIELEIAERQGIGDKLLNTGVRIIGDTVLDMGAGVANLFTLPLDIVNAVFTDDRNDYQNPVSSLLNDWRKELDEKFKVYRDTNVDITNGGLTSLSWYLDNAPSIFSSLSLLIPAKLGSTAVLKGASYLSKGIKAASKLGKASKEAKLVESAVAVSSNNASRAIRSAQLAGEAEELGIKANTIGWLKTNQGKLKSATDIGITSILSRTMENYQESQGVYDDMMNIATETLYNMGDEEFDNFKEKNHYGSDVTRDDVARDISSKSATESFKDNAWNVIFDIIQIAGLRAMWKNSRVIKSTNELDKAEKEAARLLNGKAAAENIEQIKPSNVVLNKIKSASKFVWDNKGFIAEQGTEGIEEIVNYISQEEGMHVGNLLLNKEDDKPKSDRDRILSYFEDGKLWDSAFWGFLGGMIFGTVGQKAMTYAQYGTWKDTQTEARKKAIERQVLDMQSLFSTISELNKGIDITERTHRKLDTQEEIDEKKNSVFVDAIAKIALDQGSVGNLNMFKAFLEDENVKKSLVKNGVTTQEDIEQTIQDALSIVNKTELLYNSTLYDLNKRLVRINGQIEGTIMPEYISIIANNNVRNQLQIDRLTDIENRLKSELNTEKSNINLIDDFSGQYNAIDISHRIKALEDEIENIKRNKVLGDNHIINDKQEEIEQLKSILESNPLDRAFAQIASKKWMTIPGTNFMTVRPDAFTHEDFVAIDNSITEEQSKDYLDKFKPIKALSENENTKHIDELYRQLASINIAKKSLNHKIVNTDSKIIDKLQLMHLEMEEAVKNIFDKAVKDVTPLVQKYNVDGAPIVQAVLQNMIDDPNNIDKRGISDEDFDTLKETFTALSAQSFTRPGNPDTNLMDDLGAIMLYTKRNLSAKEENKPLDNSQPSAQNNQQQTQTQTQTQQSQQNPQTSPTPNPQPQQQTQSGNKTDDSASMIKDGVKENVFTKFNQNNIQTISFDSNLKTNTNSATTIEAEQKPSGNLVLNANNEFYYKMPELYDRDGDIDNTKPIRILSYPYVEVKNGNVRIIKPGLISNVVTRTSSPDDATNQGLPGEEQYFTQEDLQLPSDKEERQRLKEEQYFIPELKESGIDNLLTNEQAFPKEEHIDVYDIALGSFMTRIKENSERFENLNNDVDSTIKLLKELGSQVAQQLVDKGLVNQYGATQQINSIIREIQMHIKFNKKDVMSFVEKNDSLGSKVVALSFNIAYNNYVNTDDLYSAVRENVKAVIDSYVYQRNYPTVNGKQYISLVDFFKYSQGHGQLIYNVVVAYINENKDKYQIIEDLTSPKAILEESFNTKPINEDDSIRVNIADALDHMHGNTDKYWDEFNKYNTKDVVDAVIDNVESNKIVLSIKNNPIGTLTRPGVDNNTGAMFLPVNGLNWRLEKDTNGYVVGDVVDFLYEFFDSSVNSTTKPGIDELRSIIYDLCYDKTLNKKQRDSKIDEIETNPYMQSWNQLIYRDKNDKAKYSEIAKGLESMVKYILSQSNINDQIDSVQVTLNNYLDKIYKNWEETYNLYNEIKNGNKPKLEVKRITEGRIINNDKTVKGQLPVRDSGTVANLISDINNPLAHRVGIIPFTGGVDSIYIAGVGARNQNSNGRSKSITPGKPFFVMPPRGNTSVTLVDCTFIDIKDISKKNGVINDVLESIYNHIGTLIQNHFDDHTGNNFDAIYEYLSKLRSNKNNASFISGLEVYHNNDNNIICIQKANSDSTIKIYKTSNYDGSRAGVRIEYKDKTKEPVTFEDANEVRQAIQKVIKECHINPEIAYIQADSGMIDNTNGLGYYKNVSGKRVFSINTGEKIFDFDSFNSFLIDNNLFKVDTHVENNANYIRRSVVDSLNATIEIGRTEFVSSNPPVEENTNTKPLNEVVADILRSDSKTKSLDIVNAVIEELDKTTITGNPKFSEVHKDSLNFIKNNSKDLFILPKIINFVGDKDSYKVLNEFGKNSRWAERIKSGNNAGTVRIGNNFLTLFDSNSESYNPIFGIETLMHEELHGKFKEDGHSKELFKLKDIYSEFYNYLTSNETITVDGNEIKTSNIISEFGIIEKPKIGNIEEFVIQTLTDYRLAKILNAIETDVQEENKGKSFFRQIIDALLDLFGFKINKKSLYYKEYLTFSELINNIADNATANKIVKDSQKYKLAEDEETYVDTDEKHYLRVTKVIENDDDNLVLDTVTNKLVPNRYKENEYSTISQNIGTGVDEFVRDYFEGLLTDMSAAEIEEKYPNATGEDYVKFREQLDKLTEQLKTPDGKPIYIVSKDVKAVGSVNIKMPNGNNATIPVLGTLDLLGYDEDGNFYIYDMKTMHTPTQDKIDKNTPKWSRQTSLYQDFLTKEYGINIVSRQIIPIHVHYDDTTVSLKYPEKKKDYNNPMRSQLIQYGDDFREAQPELLEEDGKIKLVDVPYHEASIQEENLTDFMKQYLSVDEVNNTTPPADGNANDNNNTDEGPIDFDLGIDENLLGLDTDESFRESGSDNYIANDNAHDIIGNDADGSKVINLQGFVAKKSFYDALPSEEMSKFDDLTASAEISTKCG